jgi:uncharacterized membrane protein
MGFGLYSMGFAVVIGGLTYGAHLLLMPTRWIVVGALVLVAAGYVCCSPTNEQPESPDEDCCR